MHARFRLLFLLVIFVVSTGLSFAEDIGSCPYLINTSGTYVLTRTLQPGAGTLPCILANTSNVTVNMAGFRIENATDYGLMSIGQTWTDGAFNTLYNFVVNVTVANGSFHNVSTISVFANHSVLTNLTLLNQSGTSSNFIYIYENILGTTYSTNVTLENIVVYNSSYSDTSTGAGLIYFEGINHTFKHSTVYAPIPFPVGLHGAQQLNITNVSVNSTYQSLQLAGVIYCDHAFSNFRGGPNNRSVILAATNGSHVENQTASLILVCAASNVTIQNITIDNHPTRTDGIFALATTTIPGNLIVANTVINTTYLGIYGLSYPFVIENVSVLNSGRATGTGSVYCSGTSYISSTMQSNITNLTVYNSSGSGFYCINQRLLSVRNSTFYNNTEHGIYLSSISNATVDGALVENNSKNGIYVYQQNAFSGYAEHNRLLSVTARTNGLHGVMFEGYRTFGFDESVFIPGNNLSHSTFVNNTAGDVQIYYTNRSSLDNLTFLSSLLNSGWYALLVNTSENFVLNRSILANVGLNLILNDSNTTRIENTKFNNTNITYISGRSSKVTLVAEGTLPAAAPNTYSSLSRMVNITNHTGSSNVFNLTVFYDASDVSGLDEDTVSMFVYPVSSAAWTYVSSQILSTTLNNVSLVNYATDGTFALFANATATSSSSSTGDDEAEDPVLGIEYDLEANAVTVTVEGDGDAVSNARVTLIQDDPFVGSIDEGLTDGNGKLSFNLSVSATYILRATKAGYRPATEEFAYVADLGELSVDSSFNCEEETLTVTVASEDLPLEGATIVLHTGGNAVAQGITDASGTAIFEGVSPETVTASKEGYHDQTEEISSVECEGALAYSFSDINCEESFAISIWDRASGLAVQDAEVSFGGETYSTDAQGKATVRITQESRLRIEKEGYEDISTSDLDDVEACFEDEDPAEECNNYRVVPKGATVEDTLITFAVTCDGQPVTEETLILTSNGVEKRGAVINGQAIVRFESPGNYKIQVQNQEGIVEAGSLEIAKAPQEVQVPDDKQSSPAEKPTDFLLILGVVAVVVMGVGVYAFTTGRIKI